MKKVTFLLFIFLINLLSTTFIVAAEHEHGFEDCHQHSLSSIGSASDSSDSETPFGCDRDHHCCGSCHHTLGLLFNFPSLNPAELLSTLSFPYKPLSIPQNFIDITKPPLV